MIAEVWIPITHFEGFYDISNHGRVRTVARSVRHWRGGLRRLAARVRLPGIDRDGYCHYTLCKEGKTSIHKGHRLVAMHFLPNPDNLPEVNHIDLNRRNNIVTNLQWITQYNNELHAIHTRIAQGRIKSGNTLTPEAIRDIRFLSKQGRSHVSIAKMFGVSDAHICNIVSGKRWFHLV